MLFEKTQTTKKAKIKGYFPLNKATVQMIAHTDTSKLFERLLMAHLP